MPESFQTLLTLIRGAFFFTWPIVALVWLASLRKRRTFGSRELLALIAFLAAVIAVIVYGPYEP
jgi:hypothetical protein